MKQGAVNKCDAAPVYTADCNYADLSSLDGPRFVITVDTEEEFDWDAPFSRENRGVEHISGLPRFQSLCDAHGVKPAYMIDWSIIDSAKAVKLLGGYADKGTASLGLHLHPWVTPPYREEVCDKNSYACNLSPELEREKIISQVEHFKSRFGFAADIYRAGRYGIGPNTPQILADIGIRIDSSVRPRFNYDHQFGPDFENAPVSPYWLQHGLLELPVTTVFGGILRKSGDPVFSKAFKSDTSRAIMAKAGLIERIALTPEGIPKEKAIEGIDRALEEDIGILNFSFHSPSLAIGYTPYVRSEADLEQFYDWWHAIFAHLEQRGVKPVTVEEIAALRA